MFGDFARHPFSPFRRRMVAVASRRPEHAGEDRQADRRSDEMHVRGILLSSLNSGVPIQSE